ncbi:MAG TPA: hypothetical protein VEV45_07705 [Streptosporangiaceae bacterium]|nr:hypothetical protein [Streptosporangiaceae bacterium]
MTARRDPPADRRPAAARSATRTDSPQTPARGRVLRLGERLADLAATWGTTTGRVLLGLVLAWFGYHELIQPALWTGYVPGVHAASATAIALVLAHGWVLLLLAVALIAGIAPRAAAGLAALLLAQIVIWLWASAGLSDLTLRDVGVLGLALCITSRTEQRFALRN